MSLDEEWESAPNAATAAAAAEASRPAPRGELLDTDAMAPTALTGLAAKLGSEPSASLAKGSSNTLDRPAVRAEGTTLRELTDGRLLDQRHALMLVREILAALVCFHAEHRRHGHVAPETVLVLPGLGSNRVKLTGENAKDVDPRYTAPEQAFGAADERADIYSVGAILFELLTGYPPFIADDTNALRRLHAYAPVQTLKQRAPTLTFVDALEDVVARALAKKRDLRFQTAGEAIEAIDAAQIVVEAAIARTPSPEEPRRKHDDSLLLFAKDLVVQPAATRDDALVPVNVDRHVPELPWHSRAMLQLRRVYARGRVLAARLLARFRALDRTKQFTIASIAGLVIVALAIVTCSGGGKIATRAKPAATSATADEASPAAKPEDHVDRVAAAVERLDHATSCDDRRAAIADLADSADERALPALKRAKKQKCVAKAAAAAIQKITAAAR
jgi:hypothetical protein